MAYFDNSSKRQGIMDLIRSFGQNTTNIRNQSVSSAIQGLESSKNRRADMFSDVMNRLNEMRRPQREAEAEMLKYKEGSPFMKAQSTLGDIGVQDELDLLRGTEDINRTSWESGGSESMASQAEQDRAIAVQDAMNEGQRELKELGFEQEKNWVDKGYAEKIANLEELAKADGTMKLMELMGEEYGEDFVRAYYGMQDGGEGQAVDPISMAANMWELYVNGIQLSNSEAKPTIDGYLEFAISAANGYLSTGKMTEEEFKVAVDFIRISAYEYFGQSFEEGGDVAERSGTERPTAFGRAIDRGINWVYEKLGISDYLNPAKGFRPDPEEYLEAKRQAASVTGVTDVYPPGPSAGGEGPAPEERIEEEPPDPPASSRPTGAAPLPTNAVYEQALNMIADLVSMTSDFRPIDKISFDKARKDLKLEDGETINDIDPQVFSDALRTIKALNEKYATGSEDNSRPWNREDNSRPWNREE
jgi:hypothetical protein